MSLKKTKKLKIVNNYFISYKVELIFFYIVPEKVSKIWIKNKVIDQASRVNPQRQPVYTIYIH